MTKTERQEIYLLKERGYSQGAIAKALERSPSTISREINRNSVKGKYTPDKAHQKFSNRWKKRKPYMKKIRQNNELEKYIREKITAGWSPEQVAGRWSKEKGSSIAPVSIYRYIESQFGWNLKKHLPYKGGKFKKGNKKEKVLIPERTWIDERPEVVNSRRRFGDFEGDTIVSKRGDKTSLLTLIEKQSRYLFAEKVPNKKPDKIQQVISRTTAERLVLTMTFDNGVEFAHHYKLPYQTYFCHPYSSWQKGQIEYANRLIRKFFPKKTLLKHISHQQLAQALEKINNTPRKCLNWNTPKEVFLALSNNSP